MSSHNLVKTKIFGSFNKKNRFKTPTRKPSSDKQKKHI